MQNPLLLHTALRLSRNLRGIPFAPRLNDLQRAQLTEELCAKLQQLTGFTVLRLSSLTQGQLYSMAEQRILETEHAKSPQGKAVLCSPNGKIFINVNCNNHLELLYMQTETVPERAYEPLRVLDEQTERVFPYAFDDTFGYLAPSPSDIGTGLQATVLLHLPVIKENRGILRTSDYLSQLGFTLHSAFGTGNDAPGAFYLLTNRLTMGLTENNILENLSTFAMQLARQEHLAEEQLQGSERAGEIARRMVGVLHTADALTADEAIELLSDYRLCSAFGLCRPLPNDAFFRLLTQIQPATLLNANLNCMSVRELDCRRAAILHTTLPLYPSV